MDETKAVEARVKSDFFANNNPIPIVAHATYIIDSYASPQGAWPEINHLASKPKV
tara:strand:+ start:126 stop:290 length:165 start_codon:yes stop_codon:yes gene_type:complete